MKFLLKTIRYWNLEEILLHYESILGNFKTEVSNGKLYIYIDSLQELMELYKAVNEGLLVQETIEEEPFIEIYDVNML